MNVAITNLTLHVPLWGYVVVAVIASLAGIRLFAPEILRQIYDQLVAIASILGRFFLSIGKLIFQLAEALWQLWGLVFALRWRFQFAIRYFFARTTQGVLVLGTVYLGVELIMTTYNVFKNGQPDLYKRLSGLLNSRLPAVYAWLRTLRLPHIREIPAEVDLVLFVLAVFLFRHHLKEFLASLRREAVPPALEEVFLEFDKFRDNASPDTTAKNNFLEILMKKLKDVLDEKNKRDVAFALFEEEKVPDSNGTTTKTGTLAVSFLPANSPLDKSLRIPIGQGGAGKAFQGKVAIYIPSVRHRIGIDLDNQRSAGLTYFAHKDSKYKSRSILSVPVLVNSKKDAIAVIAVSSRKRATFSDVDFEIVRLAASIISTLY